MVTFSDSIDPIMQDILFDPQTSGGLLIGVRGALAQSLLEENIEDAFDDELDKLFQT